MKTSAPVHIDRLAQALKAQGIDLKRSKVIEIAASAFGYHNSNEFQAAARRGDLSPPPAEPMGTMPLPGGGELLVLRDTQAGQPYAIMTDGISSARAAGVGVSPYGGILGIPADIVNLKPLATAVPGSSIQVSGRMVTIDADTLGTLVEAADGHAETLSEDLKDDMLSDDHRESTGETLDALEEAIRAVRASTSEPASSVTVPAVSADFRIVHKEVLDQLISAAESHSQDATSGVEEGLYDLEDNQWVAALDEAIEAARIARGPADEPAAPREGGELLYAILRTRNHDEVRIGRDERDLDRQIADHCRGEWSSLTGTPMADINPELLPDDQVIEIFYGEHGQQEESDYSFSRGSSPISPETADKVRGVRVDWGKALFFPTFQPAAIADALEAGAKADIWDDAAERKDLDAVVEVAETKIAMTTAAGILRQIVIDRQDMAPVAPKPKTDEPIWLTDVEGDVIYDITREQLERLELDYSRGDGSNDWLPLTDDEFSYLQPGARIASDPWTGRILSIPNSDGIEVRLGQSCVWKGKKWQVPSVEFSFGEGERDQAFARLEEYARDLRALLVHLDGDVRIYPDATDYAHSLDIFLPMDLALDFEGTEDWAMALGWLLCPADQRDRLTLVTASFDTPTASPGFDTRWDATFDVLREGRARALAYLQGDQDDQMTMRLAQSAFAHKDAWSLWNEDWDLELDMEALKRLYSIR